MNRLDWNAITEAAWTAPLDRPNGVREETHRTCRNGHPLDTYALHTTRRDGTVTACRECKRLENQRLRERRRERKRRSRQPETASQQTTDDASWGDEAAFGGAAGA